MDKDSKIYKQVKKEADQKFQAKTGIYKSAWIVREYKKRGGVFKDDKPKKSLGLQRWFREDWERVGKDGKSTGKPCGRNQKEMEDKAKKGLCRPVKRVTKETPKTVKELGTKELKDRYKRKKKSPNKTIK